MAQLTTAVTQNAVGRMMAWRNAARSSFSAMGKIMSHTSSTTGTDICSRLARLSARTTDGSIAPMTVPATMASVIHTPSHRSNQLGSASANVTPGGDDEPEVSDAAAACRFR